MSHGMPHNDANMDANMGRGEVLSSFLKGDLRLFTADLGALNESGVTGRAVLLLDGQDQTLTVRITAEGLEPGKPHPQHIHGRFADTTDGPGTGRPIDSVTPNLLVDDDGDGFIELAEGLDTYGPVILPLTSPPGGAVEGFPNASGGTIAFLETYDLTDPEVFASFMGRDFKAGDLTPLSLREIVLHGMTVPEGVGEGTPGEVDGTGGYLATLPVAAGEIEAVLSARDLLDAVYGNFDHGAATRMIDWDAIAAKAHENHANTDGWWI